MYTRDMVHTTPILVKSQILDVPGILFPFSLIFLNRIRLKPIINVTIQPGVKIWYFLANFDLLRPPE